MNLGITVEEFLNITNALDLCTQHDLAPVLDASSEECFSVLSDKMYEIYEKAYKVGGYAGYLGIEQGDWNELQALADKAADEGKRMLRELDTEFKTGNNELLQAMRAGDRMDAAMNIKAEVDKIGKDMKMLENCLENLTPSKDSDLSASLETCIRPPAGHETSRFSIAEAVRKRDIDLGLVKKIAQNEIIAHGGATQHDISINTVGLEYAGAYLSDGDTVDAVLTPIAQALDRELDQDFFLSDKFTPEMTLGSAVAKAATEHAKADLSYLDDRFNQRAVDGIEDMGLGDAALDAVQHGTRFDRAGVSRGQALACESLSVSDVEAILSSCADDILHPENLSVDELVAITETAADLEREGEHPGLAQTVVGVAIETVDARGDEREEAGKDEREGIDELMSAKSDEAELGDDGFEETHDEMERE